MARTPNDLPHNLPDRMVRDALLQPDNLRALIRAVAPDIADHLDYSRLEVVGKPYFLDDWRSRERDVLIRLPYRDGAGQREILLCILVEHQSDADPVMPLRMLVYAVFFWEQEWRNWEEAHKRGQPLRLTPILPVVLHTGPDLWDTSRSLADLFDVPQELKAWLPRWVMPLWDLQEHPAQELLKADDAFWQVLAVARAERVPMDEFLGAVQEALTQLETISTQARTRWDQLLRMVLHWALFRRPRREHKRILEIVRESHTNVELKREVEAMTQLAETTWEQEWKEERERCLREGEARGEARGAAQALRSTLQTQLQQRFGILPQEVVQRIAAADVERLNAALAVVLTVPSLDALPL
jgi:hypothetical protein